MRNNIEGVKIGDARLLSHIERSFEQIERVF